MASISIWVFRTKEKAEAQAEAQKEKESVHKVCGPIKLDTVDIVCQCAEPKDRDKYFSEDLADKWGIVVISYTDQ